MRAYSVPDISWCYVTRFLGDVNKYLFHTDREYLLHQTEVKISLKSNWVNQCILLGSLIRVWYGYGDSSGEQKCLMTATPPRPGPRFPAAQLMVMKARNLELMAQPAGGSAVWKTSFSGRAVAPNLF